MKGGEKLETIRANRLFTMLFDYHQDLNAWLQTRPNHVYVHKIEPFGTADEPRYLVIAEKQQQKTASAPTDTESQS